jgi:hypothetical protein
MLLWRFKRIQDPWYYFNCLVKDRSPVKPGQASAVCSDPFLGPAQGGASAVIKNKNNRTEPLNSTCFYFDFTEHGGLR